jgi:lysophospholipase L1-like esterase
MKRALFWLTTAALPLGVLALAIQLLLPRVVPIGCITYHFWGNRPTTLLPEVEHHAATADYDVRFHANSLGFNDREHPLEKPPGTLRVLLLGDSIVEAVQVQPHQHAARLVEARAAAAGRALEVIAMGTSGQGQSHQLANYLALGRARRPDVVFSVFCANDLWNNLELDDANGGRPIYVLGAGGELESTLAGRAEILPTAAERAKHANKAGHRGLRALRRLLGTAFGLGATRGEARHAARAAALYELPADAREEAADPGGVPGVRLDQRVMFEKLAAALAEEVEQRDGRRLVAVLTSGNLRHEPGSRYRAMHEWVKATFARHGVEVLDLETRLRARAEQEGRYPSWERDAHWNAVGHAWVAELLYAELEPRLGG